MLICVLLLTMSCCPLLLLLLLLTGGPVAPGAGGFDRMQALHKHAQAGC
jgi:hypothetical protein